MMASIRPLRFAYSHKTNLRCTQQRPNKAPLFFYCKLFFSLLPPTAILAFLTFLLYQIQIAYLSKTYKTLFYFQLCHLLISFKFFLGIRNFMSILLTVRTLETSALQASAQPARLKTFWLIPKLLRSLENRNTLNIYINSYTVKPRANSTSMVQKAFLLL